MTALTYPIVPQPVALRTAGEAKLTMRNPLAFEVHTPIQQVAETLRQHALEAAPVVDDSGRLVGVVTAEACNAWEEFTLRSARDRFSSGSLGSTAVWEITSPNAASIREGFSRREILELFVHQRHRRVYVTNRRNELVGVISMSDILRCLN
jgi:CBS domain-containing protein